MANNKKSKAVQVAKKLQRKIAIQQGFYDGRFREKTIKDKKKEERKRWSRKKNISLD